MRTSTRSRLTRGSRSQHGLAPLRLLPPPLATSIAPSSHLRDSLLTPHSSLACLADLLLAGAVSGQAGTLHCSCCRMETKQDARSRTQAYPPPLADTPSQSRVPFARGCTCTPPAFCTGAPAPPPSIAASAPAPPPPRSACSSSSRSAHAESGRMRFSRHELIKWLSNLSSGKALLQ